MNIRDYPALVDVLVAIGLAALVGIGVIIGIGITLLALNEMFGIGYYGTFIPIMFGTYRGFHVVRTRTDEGQDRFSVVRDHVFGSPRVVSQDHRTYTGASKTARMMRSTAEREVNSFKLSDLIWVLVAFGLAGFMFFKSTNAAADDAGFGQMTMYGGVAIEANSGGPPACGFKSNGTGFDQSQFAGIMGAELRIWRFDRFNTNIDTFMEHRSCVFGPDNREGNSNVMGLKLKTSFDITEVIGRLFD